MTSENGGRTKRTNGPLVDTAEDLASGAAQLGYGLLSFGLGLLPKQSRQHMHNALYELSHAFATLPRDFAEIAGKEIERWAEEPAAAPPRVQEVTLEREVEFQTVSTLGAAAAASPALVSITHVEYDPPGSDRDGEYVLLRNDGVAPADLTGWTLSDGGARHSYTFPAFSLAPGAEVRVWTRAGLDDAANLFWASRSAIWNNTGDTATLADASGAKMAAFSYQARVTAG